MKEKTEIKNAEDDPGGSSPRMKEQLRAKDQRKAPWQDEARRAYKTIEEIDPYIPLSAEDKFRLRNVIKQYHMRIPHYYLSLIDQPMDASDPIRQQCLPSPRELEDADQSHMDPLGEEKTSPVPCLVHRYPDRALLVITGRCFMYCRHCTRKRLWNKKCIDPTLADIGKALQYVRSTPQIREIVVSGGDPLTVNTERLDFILSEIAKIPTVEAVRIGTRAPVVLPARVDDRLCKMLSKYDRLWMNVQFNHPREITEESAAACRRLQRCGIPLSNQSVLLKGINDDPAVMLELCHKLQSIRVRPYYLFQCDPVVGASHFRTPVTCGIDIIEHMRGHTGGMCVPTFVVDGIDGHGKVPVGPNYLLSMNDKGVTLRNYENKVFFYKDGSEPAR